MPGFDRTGPEGKGSQTGRKMGKCKPNNKNSDDQIGGQAFQRGSGKGNGNGKGLGRGFKARRNHE